MTALSENDSEFLELDTKKFADFYFSLPSGQGGQLGARINQVENPIIKRLGEPPRSDGRTTVRTYWIASEETIRNWRSPTKRAVLKHRKALEVLCNEFGEDFSKSAAFSNYFLIFDEVRPFLEASSVQLEPLGPFADCSHQLRLGILTFEQSVMPLLYRGKILGEAILGFRSARVTLHPLDGTAFKQDEPKIVLEHLSWRMPESQIGKVTNATVQFDFHTDNEWKILMVPGEKLMNAALKNAIFARANLDAGQQVKLNIVVGKSDFGPYRQEEPEAIDEYRLKRAREELVTQIIRQRIDENDRYVMASGILMAE